MQERLNQMFLAGNTSMIREETPFVEFLKSPLNAENISQRVSPGGGKTRTVEVTYEQRILSSDVNENTSNPTCTASTERGNCLETYEIDTTQNLHVEQVIDIKDLEKNCMSNENWLAIQINKMVDVLVRAAEEKYAEEAQLLLGGWATDVDNVDANNALNVETLRGGTTDELAPFTMEDIELALKQSAFPGGVIFSGSTLWKYVRRAQAGCCNTSVGADIRQLLMDYGMAVLYGREVATAMGGNNHNLVVAPGAAALLEYNRVEAWDGLSDMFANARNYANQMVIDPQTGLQFDLYVKDDCGSLQMNLFHTGKLVGLPDDMFPTGDRYDGVNFMADILVANS